MSRRTRRRSSANNDNFIVADDEVELEHEQTQHQPSSSLPDGGFSALDEEQQDELVKRMIRYMVCRNAKKKPVKRQDLSRHIFHGMINIKSKSRVFAGTFAQAQQTFRHIFGMEIIEITKQVKQRNRLPHTQSQPSSATDDTQRGTKAYILVSVLPKDVRVQDKRRLAELGFLTTVAAMIILEPGCRLEQSTLYKALEKIGVHVTERNGHQQLNGGNVKDLLEVDLPNQWYIEREKEDNTFYYTLGPRLRAEIEDEDLLMFVAAVYNLGGAEENDLDDMSKKELQMRLDDAWGTERENKK